MATDREVVEDDSQDVNDETSVKSSDVGGKNKNTYSDESNSQVQHLGTTKKVYRLFAFL